MNEIIKNDKSLIKISIWEYLSHKFILKLGFFTFIYMPFAFAVFDKYVFFPVALLFIGIYAWTIIHNKNVDTQLARLNSLKQSKIESFDNELAKVFNECINEAKNHESILYAKLKYGTQEDEYGNIFKHVWDAEFDYFFENVILRKVDLSVLEDIFNYSKNELGIFNFIFIKQDLSEKLKHYLENNMSVPDSDPDEDFSEISGHEFEMVCAKELERHGWRAVITPGSGDQGIDIIAYYNKKKIGIQCKKYSSPVGNSAVQEAFSGQKHYNLKHAVVISISGYTKSARALAASTDVMLIDFSEIKDLANKIA